MEDMHPMTRYRMHAVSGARPQAGEGSDFSDLVPGMAALADLAVFANAGVQATKLALESNEIDELVANLAAQAIIVLRRVHRQPSHETGATKHLVGEGTPASQPDDYILVLESLQNRSRPRDEALRGCMDHFRTLARDLTSELAKTEADYYQRRGIRSI